MILPWSEKILNLGRGFLWEVNYSKGSRISDGPSSIW
jgi:hypothetical protein